MKKQVDVVMLPTEKATSVLKVFADVIKSVFRLIFRGKKNDDYKEYQHLYFLSDDEVKTGDWTLFYGQLSKVLEINDTHAKLETYGVLKESELEIVRSIIPNTTAKIGDETKMIHSFSLKQIKRVIATTDESLTKEMYSVSAGKYQEPLPRPSNEFLKKFCELGGIDKVLVEYEVDTIKSACTCEDSESTSNCAFSYYDGTDECCRKRFPNGEYWDKTYKLKVAPDNTITIYPIQL